MHSAKTRNSLRFTRLAALATALLFANNATHAQFRSPPDNEWHGVFTVNGSLNSGNTTTRSLGVNVDTARTSEHDRIGLYGSLLRSTSRANNVTTNTGDQQLGGARYDLNLTVDTFAFINPEFARNRLSNVRLRQTYSIGLGYRVITTLDLKLDLVAGGGYTRTRYYPNTDPLLNGERTTEVGELLLGQELNYDAGRGITFRERLAVYPAISGDGDVRGTLDTALIANINTSWAINLSSTYRYNGAAPRGTRKGEFLTLVGLAYRF